MLERRAADIEDTSASVPLPSLEAAPLGGDPEVPRLDGHRPRSLGMAIAATVAAGCLGLAVVWAYGRGSTSSVDAVGTTTDGTSTTAAAASSGTEPAPDDGKPTVDQEPGAALDAAIAMAPPGVDVTGGPMVYQGQFGTGAAQIAQGYLEDRMVGLTHELTEVETVGDNTLFRWEATNEDQLISSGSVVVRLGDDSRGVVLATTDGIEVPAAERSPDRVTAVVTDSTSDLLVADVTTLGGEIVPTAPDPDGFNDGGDPIFATAGSTNGDRLEIDVAVEPIPVVVRVQNIGGTGLSISEFALLPTSFPAECGSEPPLSIDVGELLGDLQAGPAAQATAAPLENQLVWHHAGELASIEIRWPADPDLVGGLAPELLVPGQAVNTSRPGLIGGGEPAARSGHVVIVTGPTTEGCSFVQISVLGDPAAVEWWGGALSAEWNLDYPLSVADLDPTAGPDGEPGPDESELVIETRQASERPTVPLTGTCDGLPDAPPKSGPGPGTASGTPVDALVDFLDRASNQDINPPAGGYNEVVIDDDRISYALLYQDSPYFVIDALRTADGWTIERWSSSAC
jgi:hypothetical protein